MNFLGAEPTFPTRGQTLLCSSGGGDDGEGVKSVPTLIRWLIKLPARGVSAALRGCFTEVRVRVSAAAQLFIVLTRGRGLRRGGRGLALNNPPSISVAGGNADCGAVGDVEARPGGVLEPHEPRG